MKKVLVVTLCVALLAMSCPALAYTTSELSVYINGTLARLDTEPDGPYFLGDWMIPIVSLSNVTNLKIETYYETNSIALMFDGKSVLMTFGSSYAYVFEDGSLNMYNLYSAPYVKSGDVMVPARVFGCFKDATVFYPSNTHSIDIQVKGLTVTQPDTRNTASKTRLLIQSVSAVSVPEAENFPAKAFDGDLSTRYAAQNFDATFDLGSVCQLDSVDLAFWFNEIRRQKYSLSVSADGINYVDVFNGTSALGNTYETVNVNSYARYIRVRGFGNSDNDWTSLLEIIPYGK